MTDIQVEDISKNKTVSRVLGEQRLKFTKEEFAYCFRFPIAPNFSYDSYMRVCDTYFRTSRSVKIDFTKGGLIKTKETQDILVEKETQKTDYIKTGKTYFVPVHFESGHGLTWKYHDFLPINHTQHAFDGPRLCKRRSTPRRAFRERITTLTTLDLTHVRNSLGRMAY